MLDAVENPVVFITENNIAVLTHQLNDQLLVTEITHFIEMLDMKAENTFQPRLGDRRDAAAADMLPQKHTKARRCERARFIGLCQI